MSAKAEALLEQLRKLTLTEQQEIVQQLLDSLQSRPSSGQKPYPTVKVRGGSITSHQVAEALEDE